MTEEQIQETVEGETQPKSIQELQPKMKLRGKVTRVDLFGAFVDIGVGQDGLVHISQLREGRVNRVADVVSEGDQVTVWVQKVDLGQKRISLTMIKPPERTIKELDAGMVLTGKVTRVENYGAFVDIGVERDGLVHVSEITQDYVRNPAEHVSVGDEVQVRVLGIDLRKRQIQLSMKELPSDEPDEVEEESEEEIPTSVELALKAALSQTDEKPSQKPRRKRRKGVDGDQAEALARTLRASKND